MNAIIIDPIQATLCKVPEPSFEMLKAVMEIAVGFFKLETEAEMCRWEDDGGAPYPAPWWIVDQGLVPRGRPEFRK